MSVPSPCNDVCVIEPKSGYCRGCLRTIDEIMFWGAADERWKQAVLEQLKTRSLAKKFDGDGAQDRDGAARGRGT